MKRVLILSLLLVSGCDLNSTGNRIPTLTGDRCYNWQCITPGGQERSDQIAAEQKRVQEASQKAAAAAANGQVATGVAVKQLERPKTPDNNPFDNYKP